MNQTSLQKQIEAALDALLMREPKFTGSLTLECHFQDGKAKEFTKSVEKTRHKIKDS